jgi:hypothetical protein
VIRPAACALAAPADRVTAAIPAAKLSAHAAAQRAAALAGRWTWFLKVLPSAVV